MLSNKEAKLHWFGCKVLKEKKDTQFTEYLLPLTKDKVIKVKRQAYLAMAKIDSQKLLRYTNIIKK